MVYGKNSFGEYGAIGRTIDEISNKESLNATGIGPLKENPLIMNQRRSNTPSFPLRSTSS